MELLKGVGALLINVTAATLAVASASLVASVLAEILNHRWVRYGLVVFLVLWLHMRRAG